MWKTSLDQQTGLRLELHASRIADSTKLRQEWERRLETNTRVVEALEAHGQLWRHVGGPPPHDLLQPSETCLQKSQLAVNQLTRMLRRRSEEDMRDGFETYATELIKAVSQVKLVSWSAIRRERFSLTPEGLFHELCCNAQILLQRREADELRRVNRLAAFDIQNVELETVGSGKEEKEETTDLDRNPTQNAQKDEDEEEKSASEGQGRTLQNGNGKCAVDLEGFKNKSTRKPWHWKMAVAQASEIHIDAMRTLLEIHYDDVHLRAWCARKVGTAGKAPSRATEFRVFRNVALMHKCKLNQQLILPASVKKLFQRVTDETNWDKIEQLRTIISSDMQGEVTQSIQTISDRELLANAIEACTSTRFPDQLAAGGPWPAHARVLLQLPAALQQAEISEQRIRVAALIRQLPLNSEIILLTRPQGTLNGFVTDAFSEQLMGHHSARQFAQEHGINREEMMDRLLLLLWDTLMLKQAQKWTAAEVSNLPSDETLELARWFLKGQTKCSKSIFDNICAMCGALLHGHANQNSALSNKRLGPPLDRDGNPVRTEDGAIDVNAQPPFLLRFSSPMFAEEIPATFDYDPETNAVRLRDGVAEPWKKAPPVEACKAWFYCIDCQERWLPSQGQRLHSHVPFRDRASQNYMKPILRKCQAQQFGAAATSTLEPEAEDDLEEVPHDFEGLEIPGEALEPGDGDAFDQHQDTIPDALPEEPLPSLDQYCAGWREREATYARENEGDFERHNLIPKPIPQLWQDCPHVPFAKLVSTEAQARLSVCRPHCSLEEASCANGVPRYSHITGDVCYRRRAPLQLSSTMGFVLNERSGKFMGLSPQETQAIHEILTWGRQGGNNKILAFYGTAFESFRGACKQLMDQFRNVMPEGCHRARIRMTKRETKQPMEGTLADTLGEEACGMVVVDSSGHPMKYDALKILEGAVGTQHLRIELDVPREGGSGWRRTASHIDTQEQQTLNDSWRQDLTQGAGHLLQETWVPANDPHLDAKVWPHVHCYGTGSLLSEPGSGGVQRHARNRLMLLQSWFRRSPTWAFWFLGRLHQTELFFKNKKRREHGRLSASVPDDADPVNRLFGTAMPADIPESTEWWKRQSRDLLAMSDEAEMDLMQCMVTVTANDSCPEMLAAIRRGPLAAPTSNELIEYLLTRKRRDQERPPFENYSLEHVIAFQRRVSALKTSFMQRGKRTPLGIVQDWWDRTEAQQRAALHSHILCWFKLRPNRESKIQMPPIPRTVQGDQPRQRPRSQIIEKISPPREDNIYQHAFVGRINTEMVRPTVNPAPDYGGYDQEKLRIAGLARHIQSHLYLHKCSPHYCMQNRSTCRFFFPWPQQPQQQYDENTERVAGKRTLEADDQWLNPHVLYLAMFSPATVHVLPFDPCHGSDTARQYASKYASKAEKWYFLEGERTGVKEFLKCRTVGLCMTHNRLLNYHVVRSTKPVQYSPTSFLPTPGYCTPRDEAHKTRYPNYPDTKHLLSQTGKYFFRNEYLRPLRLEQFNRYFTYCSNEDATRGNTLEDTVRDETDEVPPNKHHKHYDPNAEDIMPGRSFEAIAQGIPSVRRRMQARLAVNRVPFIEPIGDKREAFYEQRLLLGLSWYCATLPEEVNEKLVWYFVWTPPAKEDIGGAELPSYELQLGGEHVSFEHLCATIESEICRATYHVICPCCANHLPTICSSCRHAVGFHRCQNNELSAEAQAQLRWKKGTLYADKLDGERALFNLHRKGMPIKPLKAKADEYEAAGIIRTGRAKLIISVIQQERGKAPIQNDPNIQGGASDSPGTMQQQGPHAAQQQGEKASDAWTTTDMTAELKRRETCLQAGATTEGVTDQWRVYRDITNKLQSNEPCRMMVQASAGTGKSFLLTTVYLWCVVHGLRAKAAAPTGIAAANIEIEGTDVSATTLHSFLELDGELQTKLDLAKVDQEKVRCLMELHVLLIDEVSMIDTDVWTVLESICSTVDDSRRPRPSEGTDAFGSLHVILFGDFKQLPPATSLPPFIVHPSVYENFDFRVLKQNRRVVTDERRRKELDNFHDVLTDISEGNPTTRVEEFLVQAYVRGAATGCAQRAELEGSTSVFTKRRYRDKWNRIIVRRAAKVRNHSLKIKGRVRARGARGQQWFSEQRAALTRKKSRPQALWYLHLAGDWHPHYETENSNSATPHMMRCMLVSNLAIDQRFANGTQGRLMYWHPSNLSQKRKALPASHPELMARFVKETALKKSELVADLDHMDITARQETLTTIPGQPVLLQLCVVPAYALTVHKVQALSIKHVVRGCLEGIFAQGQLYVLISRATDPQNIELVGIPPKDLLPAVKKAWRAAGFDPIECLRMATSITSEFEFQHGSEEDLKPRYINEKQNPVKWRSIKGTLQPQEAARLVMQKLLGWIESVDQASQTGAARPPFRDGYGGEIFPTDEKWWLTDIQQQKNEVEKGDEDGPPSSHEGLEDESDGAAEPNALTDDEDPSSNCSAAGEDPIPEKEHLPRSSFQAEAAWPQDGPI